MGQFSWERLNTSYVRYPGRVLWGTDNGETATKNNAFTIIDGQHLAEQPKSILEFVRSRPNYEGKGCIVIVDATVYAYERDKRNLLIDEAEANNITLLGKQTRYEARLRAELDIEKSDENDAQLAYYIGRHTKFAISKLRRLPEPVFQMEKPAAYPPGTPVITSWQAYANFMRRSGTQLSKPWVQDFLSDVPQFRDLSQDTARSLGNIAMSNYDRDFILLAVAVARDARLNSETNREYSDELGRCWGWCGAGHRGYPRSTFYRRAVTLAKREVKPQDFSEIAWLDNGRWEGDIALRRKYLKEEQISLRRAIRRISPWKLAPSSQ